MGGLEMSEDATYTASISVTDGVDGEWRGRPHGGTTTLSLTMTIVNPNIVIEPSSHAAFPKGLWVDDDIVVTTNEVSGYFNRDQAMIYDRATQQYLEDRSFLGGEDAVTPPCGGSGATAPPCTRWRPKGAGPIPEARSSPTGSPTAHAAARKTSRCTAITPTPSG